MAIFDNFPYTNIHELNLDWLLKTTKAMKDKTDRIDQSVTDAEGYAIQSQENADLVQNILTLLSANFVTPEMFNAVGDGITDDTQAVQDALDSGTPVLAGKKYLVTNVTVHNTELYIAGEIIGQVIINNQAIVHGGKITQTSNEPCVKFESVLAGGQGYMNSRLYDCTLTPTATGIGIQLWATTNALFGFYINNVDIASCEKAIHIYDNKWITKGDFENIFCHQSKYVIFVENLVALNTYCADITFRNVYAQYYGGVPLNFLKLDSGACLFTFDESFVYDGIGDKYFSLSNRTDTRITFIGSLKFDPKAAAFTNATSLRNFYFQTHYGEVPTYMKMGVRTELPVDWYGGVSFENMSSPSATLRFAGLVSRGGVLNGASEPNKVYGVSFYDGRLSVLRSTDGTVANGKVVEVTTPYSGGVYTTATLPSGVRDGATVWCSDIKMPLTYYVTHWYKPDGTQYV